MSRSPSGPLPARFDQGRAGKRPRAVVIHTTDGTFAGTLAWFASPRSGVSAHYVVGLDGRIAEVVDEADTAYHAGMRPAPTVPVLGEDPPNLVTIGIEFEDDRRPHDVVRTDAQYRAGAMLLAGIAERWSVPLDRDHVLPHHCINPAKTCPGNLDIDRLLAEAKATSVPRRRPRLVVLLPARNAQHDLPAWFESVERFADAVVALDDGSTDRTGELLARHPLVQVLLTNPRRDSYEGWDDGANRNRLLCAASDLEPDWVLSLDADERLSADDAEALRAFVDIDALPGLAYGLQCYRMWGRSCDPRFGWVYRLFAYEPGQRFPDQQLHFDPVPVGLGPERHVRTSLRIQHWGSSDETRRAARLAKYRQADPEGRFATGHGGLDDPPASLADWIPRPPDLPVLLERRPISGR